MSVCVPVVLLGICCASVCERVCSGCFVGYLLCNGVSVCSCCFVWYLLCFCVSVCVPVLLLGICCASV